MNNLCIKKRVKLIPVKTFNSPLQKESSPRSHTIMWLQIKDSSYAQEDKNSSCLQQRVGIQKDEQTTMICNDEELQT
jgi:hypothetical protein